MTAQDKVEEGGGLVEEGELITVVERSVEEVEEYLAQDQVTDCMMGTCRTNIYLDQVNSPVGLLYGIQWYMLNRLPQVRK